VDHTFGARNVRSGVCRPLAGAYGEGEEEGMASTVWLSVMVLRMGRRGIGVLESWRDVAVSKSVGVGVCVGVGLRERGEDMFGGGGMASRCCDVWVVLGLGW